MESPSIWDLVTGSLAVCDLEKPASAWAFLVVQGLVRDEAGDRDTFLAILTVEQARGEITGPSVVLRVAGSLKRAGIALPAGLAADPWGAMALRRVDVVAEWGFQAAGQHRDERRKWLIEKESNVRDEQGTHNASAVPDDETMNLDATIPPVVSRTIRAKASDVLLFTYQCVDCGMEFALEVTDRERRSSLREDRTESCGYCGQKAGYGRVQCGKCQHKFVARFPHRHVDCNLTIGSCPHCGERCESPCAC